MDLQGQQRYMGGNQPEQNRYGFDSRWTEMESLALDFRCPAAAKADIDFLSL